MTLKTWCQMSAACWRNFFRPDCDPPAICLISLENPLVPNWQDRSWRVLGPEIEKFSYMIEVLRTVYNRDWNALSLSHYWCMLAMLHILLKIKSMQTFPQLVLSCQVKHVSCFLPVHKYFVSKFKIVPLESVFMWELTIC